MVKLDFAIGFIDVFDMVQLSGSASPDVSAFPNLTATPWVRRWFLKLLPARVGVECVGDPKSRIQQVVQRVIRTI